MIPRPTNELLLIQCDTIKSTRNKTTQHHFSNVHISIKSADFHSGHILFISDTSVYLLQSISSSIMQMFPACKRGKKNKKKTRRKQTLCMRRGVRPLQDVNLNATRATSRGPESLLWEGNVTRYRFKCSREIIKYHR